MKDKLILEWKSRGNGIVDLNKKEEWDNIVENNINSMYGDLLFKGLLVLIKYLNEDKSFEEVKKEIDKQDRSDYSFKVMCSFLKKTTERGEDFVKYLLS